MMPNGDPRDGFFYPTLTPMLDSYYVYRGGRPMHAVYGNPMYGRGKGRVWMNGVNCTGNEKHLNECEFPGWAINEPGHGQDVTVQCLPSGSITETYKRKYPGGNFINEFTTCFCLKNIVRSPYVKNRVSSNY